MLADEKATSACAFLLAALRYYKTLGVRIERIVTDNGSAYKSRRFTKLLGRLRIKHIRTRPYTPRTNGKAERFIQTLLREWAYAFVYPSSRHRTDELQPWMYHYNFHRPHSRLKKASRYPPRLRWKQRPEKLQLEFAETLCLLGGACAMHVCQGPQSTTSQRN